MHFSFSFFFFSHSTGGLVVPFRTQPVCTTTHPPLVAFAIQIHPFTPESSGSYRSTSLVPLVTSSVLTVLNKGVGTSQTIPKWAWFSQTGHRKTEKNVRLTWKFECRSCSTTLQLFLQTNSRMLKFFTIAFPTKMKPSKCPGKEKKNWARKAKGKSGGSSVTFCACLFFKISNLESGTRQHIARLV